MKLFHHCSYLSLGPDRGVDETKAVPDVKWLFETRAGDGGVIVSPSWPIPAKGIEGGRRRTSRRTVRRPTHHRRVVRQLDGTFVGDDGAALEGRAQAVRLRDHGLRHRLDHRRADGQRLRRRARPRAPADDGRDWLAAFEIDRRRGPYQSAGARASVGVHRPPRVPASRPSSSAPGRRARTHRSSTS